MSTLLSRKEEDQDVRSRNGLQSRGAGLLILLAGAVLPALSGCGNPSYDVQIEALAADPNPPSADHRRGQPCLLCHGPYKGARPQMVVAGTVFADRTDKDDAGPGGTVDPSKFDVKVYDDSGTATQVSNAGSGGVRSPQGNFYFTYPDYNALFPMGAELYCGDGMGGLKQFTMQGRISREGSCNACHVTKPDQSSPGWLSCQ